MKLRATPKLIGFTAVLVLSMGPALLAGGLAGWLPFCALLLCGGLSLAQLLWLSRRLDYAAQADTHSLVRGGELPLRLTLRNRTPLPAARVRAEFFIAGLDGADLHVYPLDLTLSPREERTFSLSSSFLHIGLYQTGVRRLAVWDLFGNFQAVGRLGEVRQLEVQPLVPELRRLPVSPLQVLETQRAAALTPLSGMDYTGVREYAYGDPIKTIQWKLSAHAGTLMTKQMESYTNAGVTVSLDFHVPGYPEEIRLDLLDGLVETAAAVGEYALREGMDCQLLYLSPQGEERRYTPPSFRDLRHCLPDFRLQPDDQEADLTARVLREGTAGLHSQNNVVLCAARLTPEMASTLLRLRQGRKNVCFCYFLPNGLPDARRQELLAPLKTLQGAGISCVTAADAAGMVSRT